MHEPDSAATGGTHVGPLPGDTVVLLTGWPFSGPGRAQEGGDEQRAAQPRVRPLDDSDEQCVEQGVERRLTDET